MSVFFEFDEVSAFTVGTIGRPGERRSRMYAPLIGRDAERQRDRAVAQGRDGVVQLVGRAPVVGGHLGALIGEEARGGDA